MTESSAWAADRSLKGFQVSGFVVEQRGELELEVGIGAFRASLPARLRRAT
jgi:hypothetical protein